MLAARLCASVGLLLACALTLTAACSGSDCPPGTVLLTSYTSATGTPSVTTSSSWTFSPSTGVASLNRASIRPPFPTPEDEGSLRRDGSFYVPSLEMVYEMHSLAPTDAKAHVKTHPVVLTEDGIEMKTSTKPAAPTVSSEFFSYSLFTNSSTLIQPVPDYSFTCTQYDPVLDLVLALSSVYEQNGTSPFWNVSLVVVEYNGDFYGYYQPFYTIALPDPVGAAEDPCRPQCAYDSGRSLFSWHWPAPAATPSPANRGTLYTVNVTYLNFEAVGELIAESQWPNNFANPSMQPVVLGMAYSPAFPGAISYFATGALNEGEVGAVAAYVDPLTLTGGGLVLQQDQSEYESPRVMVTDDTVSPALVVVESASPFRYTTWAIQSDVVATGQVAFSDTQPTSVLGLHSWLSQAEKAEAKLFQ
jgi:hypothetical protein